MRKSVKKSASAVKVNRTALLEQLEDRKLMAAVVDLRLAGGGTQVVNPTAGQTVNFEVWVTVTGANATITDEQLQIAVGSILSSNTSGGTVKGDITTTLVDPFTALGSQNGSQADLDSDGDLDIGSNDPSVAAGFLYARAESMQDSGVAVSNGQSFKIATGSFNVTGLLSGIRTDLVFRPRGTQNGFLYKQDDTLSTENSGAGLTAGTRIALIRTPSSTINGRVFNDKNANGFFDGDDTGIDGFRLYLDTNANAQLDEGEISKPVSATGTYHFTNVPPGTYRVREVFRSGWRQTFPASNFYEVTLGYNEEAKSQSMANTDTILIKGKVWNDSNHNKLLDTGEGFIWGMTVYLDQDNDGIQDSNERFWVTNSRGEYRFDNIPAGKYVVRAVQYPNKWRQTTPGGSGAHTITLGLGGAVSNKNFGFKRIA
jgi:hypothetical protein